MHRYTAITIIYNPHSTGPSKKLADKFKKEVEKKIPQQKIELIPTQHAGHGEELAYEYAMASKRPLVISSSGDGGYHEVINGLMRAQKEGAKPVAGLLPAGNANDHFNALHVYKKLDSRILDEVKTIDLLRLDYSLEGEPHVRYAHSYIGLGLTPEAGKELNKHTLNWLKEIVIVARVILILKPIQLIIRGKLRSYDSLIFSNIGKMSKFLSLSDVSSVDDGKFEIIPFRRRNKIQLIVSLLTASTRGLKSTSQAKDYRFETVNSLPVQLDGEVIILEEGAKARVTIEQTILQCAI